MKFIIGRCILKPVLRETIRLVLVPTELESHVEIDAGYPIRKNVHDCVMIREATEDGQTTILHVCYAMSAN